MTIEKTVTTLADAMQSARVEVAREVLYALERHEWTRGNTSSSVPPRKILEALGALFTRSEIDEMRTALYCAAEDCDRLLDFDDEVSGHAGMCIACSLARSVKEVG